MRSRPTAEAEAMKFRAPTLEEAVAIAEEALGGRVKVLEANRIRRGGFGGFFATDLGVEVSVLPEEESIEEALERLVAESDADERRHWQRRSTARPDEAALSPSPVQLDPEMLVPEPTEPEISMAALRAMATLQLDDQPPAPRAARRLRPSAELVSAQDIVDELRVLAERDAAARATGETPAARASTGTALAPEPPATPSPSATPRPRKLASPTPERPAATAATAPAPRPAAPAPTAPAAVTPAPAAVTPASATPAPAAATAASATPAPAAATPASATQAPAAATSAPAGANSTPTRATGTTRTERVVRGDDGPAVITTETGSSLEVVTPADVDVLPAKRSTAAPSRRHVELTIAAADQLIDSLSRNGSAQRLSVRVVLRSGDQREVEAEAHWEAPTAIDRRNVTEVG